MKSYNVARPKLGKLKNPDGICSVSRGGGESIVYRYNNEFII